MYTIKTATGLIIALMFFSSCTKENRTTDAEKKTEQKTTTIDSGNSQSQNSPNTNVNSQNAAGDDNGNKDLTYDIQNLPKDIKYEGKIAASVKWTDKNGENYIIITETAEKKQKEDNRMKELFAYHYTVNNGAAKQLWKINDFIKDCPLDITLEYMPKSISVTDLDKNGTAETTFLYRMSCKGDVSEDDMKLIMHEGDIKYAIRGSMKLKMQGETYGGKMNVDPSFDRAPKEFLDYSREQWNKFQTEKIGN